MGKCENVCALLLQLAPSLPASAVAHLCLVVDQPMAFKVGIGPFHSSVDPSVMVGAFIFCSRAQLRAKDRFQSYRV